MNILIGYPLARCTFSLYSLHQCIKYIHLISLLLIEIKSLLYEKEYKIQFSFFLYCSVFYSMQMFELLWTHRKNSFFSTFFLLYVLILLFLKNIVKKDYKNNKIFCSLFQEDCYICLTINRKYVVLTALFNFGAYMQAQRNMTIFRKFFVPYNNNKGFASFEWIY